MPYGNARGQGYNNGEITVAEKVVVSGPGNGVFIYNGTPGFGNPPVITSSNSTVDPFGNPIIAGEVVYVHIASGPAAGNYALQLGQVSILGTPAPGFFIVNTGSPANIPASVVALTSAAGTEIILGSGASTGLSNEAAVVVSDSTFSGIPGGVVNIVAGQLQVNGVQVNVP